MKKKPGQDFAELKGYSLISFADDLSQANYSKRISKNYELTLICHSDEEATLVGIVGLIWMTTHVISIREGNNDFDLFESNLKADVMAAVRARNKVKKENRE